MKRLLLVFLTAFSFTGLKAQVFYNEMGADASRNLHYSDSVAHWRVQHHIASIREYKLKADSATGHSYLYQDVIYDNAGNFAETDALNRKGKITSGYTYTWDAQHHYTGYTYFTRNKKYCRSGVFVYNQAGDLVEEKYFKRRPDKLAIHSFMTYDANHNMLQKYYLYNNDKKKGWKVEFSYYPDGSKKQTIEYNAKGKIKHIWNYDCSPIGKLQASRLKDTTKMCIRYETDKDGRQIKIKEEFVKMGIVRRIITKYNSRNKVTEEIRFDKNDRIVYRTVSAYDANGRFTEFLEYGKNQARPRSHTVYKYTSDGQLALMIDYDHNNKPKSFLKYQYVKG